MEKNHILQLDIFCFYFDDNSSLKNRIGYILIFILVTFNFIIFFFFGKIWNRTQEFGEIMIKSLKKK